MERSNNCVHVHFELSDVNITVVPGESGPPAPTLTSLADLETKYSGKTMYVVPGVGGMQGSYVIEGTGNSAAMFFKYKDDDGVNRKLKVWT